MKPKYTIELFDLPGIEDGLTYPTIGYRVISNDINLLCLTDADYLMHQLTETLSRIGKIVPEGDE